MMLHLVQLVTAQERRMTNEQSNQRVSCRCLKHLEHGECERNCACGQYDQVLMTIEEKQAYITKRRKR